MGVNRNLLGGIALRDAIKASMPSATINDEERYIQFPASAATSISISEAAGMIFKPNTQYTFILSLYKITSNNNKTSNLRISYTDGTWNNIPNLSAVETKEAIVFTSDAGKTIDKFYKINSSSTTRVYYDESGIFEGVLTTLDFEPYQAWGITMSGIRRSLVEAALHDDTTVAAPIATFSTDVAAPAKSVLAAFSPIQDLHGYENPWPAGGGVNKLDLSQATSNTGYGITGSVSGDVVSISGTWTGGSAGGAFRILRNISVSSTESLSVKGFLISGTDISSAFRLSDDNTTLVIQTKAIEPDTPVSASYRIIAYEGDTAPASWTPYSNICPISGRTGLTAYRTGVNLWGGQPFADAVLASCTSAATQSGNIVTLPNGATNVQAGSNNRVKMFENQFQAGSYTIIIGQSDTEASLATRSLITGFYTDGTSTAIVVEHYDATKRLWRWVSNPTKTLAFLRMNRDDSNRQEYDISRCGIFKGDVSVTDFAPYVGTSFPVTWTEAGTVYGGTVDLVSGLLTVDRYYFKGGWTQYNSSNGFRAYRSAEVPYGKYPEDVNNKPMSNTIGKFGNFSSSAMTENIIQPPRRNANGAYMALDENLSPDDVDLCYLVAEPQTYQLTPTQIDLLKGANNLWQSENGDMTVGYWLHG